MLCPKCGHPRDPGPECSHCGVVYAKLKQVPGHPPARSTRRSGNRWWIAIVAVGALAVSGIVAWARLHGPPIAVEPSASPTNAPTVTTPGTTSPAGTAARVPADSPPAPVLPPAPHQSALAPAVTESDSKGPPPEPAICETFSLSGVPGSSPAPSVSSVWYEGASGFRRASDEQASSGAPLLLFFHVDWCLHCRRFISEVLPSPEMRELGRRIVKVKVNAEGSEDDRALAQRLSVRSYPTLLVVSAPGRPPARIEQWGSPRAFVESCQRLLPNPAREHLDKGVSLLRGGATEQAATELKAATADPALAAGALDHLGFLALRANCFSRAEAIYSRLLDIDSAYQGGRIYHLRGFARFRSGDLPRALEDAERACRLGFKEGCTAVEQFRPKTQ